MDEFLKIRPVVYPVAELGKQVRKAMQNTQKTLTWAEVILYRTKHREDSRGASDNVKNTGIYPLANRHIN